MMLLKHQQINLKNGNTSNTEGINNTSSGENNNTPENTTSEESDNTSENKNSNETVNTNSNSNSSLNVFASIDLLLLIIPIFSTNVLSVFLNILDFFFQLHLQQNLLNSKLQFLRLLFYQIYLGNLPKIQKYKKRL